MDPIDNLSKCTRHRSPLHSQYPTHQLHEVECCQQYPDEAMGVEGDRVLRGGEDDDKGYHYHEGTQDLDGGRDKTFMRGVQDWLLLEVINSVHM